LDKTSLAKREIELLGQAIEATQPDHAVVLFADPVMRWLARAPVFRSRISVFVMFANAHFPRAYDLPLTPRERVRALFKERNIDRWRRREDAHAIFGLDVDAVAGWARRRGAKAIWLPEPPLEVEPKPRPASERSGALLFGYMDERKGVDRLGAALSRDAEGLQLTILGDVAPEYHGRLEAELARMESAGIRLETDLRRVPYADAMTQMASSRCALLSFGWRPSGSRVLLEAASARTPVVTGNDNAVGRLVERYGLGLTVDPADPDGLREAILSLAMDADAPVRFEKGLRHYAEEVHGDRFEPELRAAFGIDQRESA
jgi:glycosyltransferase involved in cell wall biosynthesis